MNDDSNHYRYQLEYYFMKYMPVSRKKTFKYCLILLCILEMIWGFGSPTFAQRSRRTSAVPVRKSGTTLKGKGSASAQTTTELEERNKELLKQIMDLQYERDFYMRKISEWTESQRALPGKPQPEQKAEPEPKAPLYVPVPMTGFQSYDGRPAHFQVDLPADSLLNRIRINLGRGYYDEALRAGEKLVASAGCGDRHYFEYGSLLYKLGDYKQALDILSCVSQNDSLIAIAAFYKGRIYQEQNSFKVAEVEFQRSRVLGRGLNSHIVARGYQFLVERQPDSAAIAFGQALSTRSRALRAEIYAGLAEVSFLKGDRSEEIKQLQQSLVYDPVYILTNFNLGVALYEAGEYQSALFFLLRVENYSLTDINVHLYLGQTYYHLQQWDQALTQLLRIDRQKWPEDTGLFTWLPKTYYIKSLRAKAEGNYFDATNYFRKAREVNADANSWMQAALTDLAEIYQEGKNFNSALDFYSHKLRLDPNDGQTLVKMGITYYQAGDLQAAREVLLKALKNPTVAGQAENWLKQISLYSVN